MGHSITIPDPVTRLKWVPSYGAGHQSTQTLTLPASLILFTSSFKLWGSGPDDSFIMVSPLFMCYFGLKHLQNCIQCSSHGFWCVLNVRWLSGIPNSHGGEREEGYIQTSLLSMGPMLGQPLPL